MLASTSMHVAIIADNAWLDEELGLFQRLVVGFLDQQVRVTQVVPEGRHHEETSAFGQLISWQDTRWRGLRRHRLSHLAQDLDELGVDLIHALDGRLWAGAVRLAMRLRVPVVLGLSSLADAAMLRSLPSPDRMPPVTILATTDPLYQDARRQVPNPQVGIQTAPIGVHAPPTTVTPKAHPEPLCAIVTGSGICNGEYESILDAIRLVIADHPDAQFFFDGCESSQHTIWQAARRLGVLPNISLLTRRRKTPELLLQGDVLLQPQAMGRSRSLTLQAMAHGLPVIAREDRWLDYLIDDQTAWVIPSADEALWAAAMLKTIRQPQDVLGLTRRAQQWVRQHRLASTQIDQTLDIYQQMVGESIKFPHRH